MSGKSKRNPSLHPKRKPRAHEIAKLDQSLAKLRDITARSGIPGAIRAFATGQWCCWCDCPMERHIKEVKRIAARGVNLLDAKACHDAFETDFCGGCGNKALSVWTFTDQQVTYPICEQHDAAFRSTMISGYGDRTLVVPQRIYDDDII